MPTANFYTRSGTSFLSGNRASVRKRGFGSVYTAPRKLAVLDTGKTLNGPESDVFWALKDLKIRFGAQEPIDGATTLGGALADFILFDYSLIIEYQGPFHGQADGVARDFWRKVVREQAGFMVAYLFERDLVRLHRRITEIIGHRAIQAVMSRT
jgi:very-short-patch-repair endonuclease